ncbi:hypothetical protein [Cysteiniphilum marinum]|uniref:hypothetical protein n=1 Tax=Cysteiniphilum marinum TaxID=2774191 RepID=UPI00193AEB58|nr:hypothetical protein [Cysteiniphilum marinum]
MMKLSLLYIMASLGVAVSYAGTFHIKNNTMYDLKFSQTFTMCADNIRWMDDDGNSIQSLIPSQEATLSFDYSSACGQSMQQYSSIVKFSLENGADVVSNFAASLGSISEPQNAYYRAYLQDTDYSITKVDQQTYKISNIS